MATRLSTGFRDKLAEYKAAPIDALTATTISFGDGTGTGGLDQILDSGNGLAGFEVRKNITVVGSTSNDGTYDISGAVAAGSIEIPAGSLTTEAAGDQVILVSADGGSVSDILRNGTLDIYSGSQPAGGDSAETGTLLVSITLSGASFTPGAAANGINFYDSTSGVLSKAVAESWTGTAVATGTAGWFRFYDNAKTTGASSSGIRFDGSVATSGAQLNMANTSISSGGSVTIDTFTITIPAS